jgi:hypothetical protein
VNKILGAIIIVLISLACFVVPVSAAGCPQADELMDQATEVISGLTKITPADVASQEKTVLELQRRAGTSIPALKQCFLDEVNGTGNAIAGLTSPTARLIGFKSDYLNFIYQVRFTEGDKSYLSTALPSISSRSGTVKAYQNC